MSTYAVVKTGGKQYRVHEGQWLLVERLRAAEGEKISLQPLLYVGDGELVDGEGLHRVSVDATVLGHERGPKLRVVKFKPKRGYKRRNGHRQELTRIQVTGISLGAEAGRPAKRSRPRKAAAAQATPEPIAADAPAVVAAEPAVDAPAAVKRKARAAKAPVVAEAEASASAGDEAEATDAPVAAKPRPKRKPRKKEAEDGS
jgi:large subunit ribosomal protein L21